MAHDAAAARDRDTDFLIAAASAVIALLIAAYFAHDYVVYGLLKMAQFKFTLLGFLSEDYAEAATKLASAKYGSPSTAAIQAMSYSKAFMVTFQAAIWFAIPVSAWLFLSAVRVLFKDPARRFRRPFTMETMLAAKAEYFPAVRPVLGLKLHKTDPFSGPWRLAEDYIRFSLSNRLIRRSSDRILPPGGKRQSIKLDGEEYRKGSWPPAYTIITKNKKRRLKVVMTPEDYSRDERREHRFDRERALQVFIEQLGPSLYDRGKIRISQWQEWPKQHRALMAAFLLIRFGPGDRVGREAGMRMLEQFSNSFYVPNYKKKGKPPIRIEDLDMTGVNQVISTYLALPYELLSGEKPYDFPKPKEGRKTINAIRKAFSDHAYLNTLMVRLLELARERGILITSDLIWLRPIDRSLFYALNNTGRNNIKNATALVEGAGVIAHYMVEESLGFACINPEVDKAVDGLEAGLIKEGWIEDQRIKTKKRNRRA